MCGATSLDEGPCAGAIAYKRRLNAASRCSCYKMSVWDT